MYLLLGCTSGLNLVVDQGPVEALLYKRAQSFIALLPVGADAEEVGEEEAQVDAIGRPHQHVQDTFFKIFQRLGRTSRRH